jgi:hypothetical protein
MAAITTSFLSDARQLCQRYPGNSPDAGHHHHGITVWSCRLAKAGTAIKEKQCTLD